jgi:hypothetical protein
MDEINCHARQQIMGAREAREDIFNLIRGRTVAGIPA